LERPAEGGRPAIPVLLGATAVGKTAVGVELALRIDGEILSADSRAFFEGLDIVTDKPSEAARRGVPHHLLDIVPICGAYDAMAFRRDVKRLVPEIRERDRVPVVVGGGTLYLRAVLRGIFEGPGRDAPLRATMQGEATEALHRRLAQVDPEAAQTIHPNDRLRLCRALEVYERTGRPISAWQSDAAPLPYSFFVVGLRRERDDHRAAVAERVRRMIERGLLGEVERLRRIGLDEDCQAYRTIGIPEAAAVLDGRASSAEMEMWMVHRTWDLVRRQTAWFRREQNVRWWDVTRRRATEVADEIAQAWRRSEAGDGRA